MWTKLHLTLIPFFCVFLTKYGLRFLCFQVLAFIEYFFCLLFFSVSITLQYFKLLLFSSLFLFAIGYFVYDTIDILLNDGTRQKPVLIHHFLVREKMSIRRSLFPTWKPTELGIACSWEGTRKDVQLDVSCFQYGNLGS